MEKVKVKILTGGVTAKEVNPWGEERPSLGKYERKGYENSALNSKVNIWEAAESKLRTFQIDFSHLNALYRALEEKAGGEIVSVLQGYEVGSIHSAEVLTDGKIRII